jgi:serine protease Do
VTNHHVVEGAAKVTAALSDGRTIDVSGILADDPVRDIAVVQATPGTYAPLPLGTSATLRVGDEVAILGSPLGLSASLSAGIVSAMRERGPSTPFDPPTNSHVESWGIQVTAPISHGSSGSPIMNRSGDVVAVAVGLNSAGEGLGFGVPVEVAKAALDAIPAGAAPKPFAHATGHPVLQNLGISAAVFVVPYVVFVAWRRWSGARTKQPRLRS